MSRRAKLLLTAALFLVLLSIFAVVQQLMWMPAHPLEFRFVEFRPDSATSTSTSTTASGETFGTVIIEVTNHASASLVLRRVDLLTVPLKELEGTLEGDPLSPLFFNYGRQHVMGFTRPAITLPEGQATRMEIPRVWSADWQDVTRPHNVLCHWQTSLRQRWEKLMHRLGSHLPNGVPQRLTPREGIVAAPLK